METSNAAMQLRQFAVALADALIPGEEEFPSASNAGAVEPFVKRLCDLQGERHLEKIRATLSTGGRFESLGERERENALAILEKEQHPLFEEMLAVLYLSYYESSLVTAAIQGLGLTYHNPPQPHGYRMSNFNADDPLEFPHHGRGNYVPTDQVRRVPLAGLDHLEQPVAHP